MKTESDLSLWMLPLHFAAGVEPDLVGGDDTAHIPLHRILYSAQILTIHNQLFSKAVDQGHRSPTLLTSLGVFHSSKVFRSDHNAPSMLPVLVFLFV